MGCRKIKKRISALLDGELQGKERTKVEAHLVTCAGCKREMERMKSLRTILDAQPSVAPSPFLAERMIARIKGKVTEDRDAVSKLVTSPAWMRWATVALAIFIGIFVGVGIGQNISRNVFWDQRESFELMAWEDDPVLAEPIAWMIGETAEEEKK